MTLILGFNLQDSLYLASDSRLTYETVSGLHYVKDRWRKFHCFNAHLHCVAAGSPRFASYLMRKINESNIINTQNFRDFESNIQQFLQEEAGLYDEIHKLPKTAFIFGGVDERHKKEINMSSVFDYIPKDGRKLNMTMRQEIKMALAKHAFQRGTGTIFQVDGIPYSNILGVEVIATNEGTIVNMKSVPFGKYVAYGEGGFTEQDVPTQLYFDLDLLPPTAGETGEDVLRRHSARITDFYVREAIPQQMDRHQNFSTVGGTINVFRVTEHGAIFPAGTLVTLDYQGKILAESSIIVRDGKHYVKIAGQEVEQKPVYDFYGSSEEEAMVEATI